MSTQENKQTMAVFKALSAERLSTYVQPFEDKVERPIASALELYIWNTEVSAAFLAPLHICEVVIRNAVSEVLESVYGPDWPRTEGFQQSLPSFFKDKIQDACDKPRLNTTGKIIADMSFAFWKDFFTSRYEDRLWKDSIHKTFPNVQGSKTVSQTRGFIHGKLGKVNDLRNRIAHHEPIVKRVLQRDLILINNLIEARCKSTSRWMMNLHEQSLKDLIDSRPPIPQK